MNFLNRNAVAIQAFSAVLTVVLALGALLGVKFQIDASERSQREQSARDIYREFLNLSISRPEFAAPNYCAIRNTQQEPAYENYVEYLLYAAEQSISVDDTWQPVFENALQAHQTYICDVENWAGYSDEVQTLVKRFVNLHCAEVKPCN